MMVRVVEGRYSIVSYCKYLRGDIVATVLRVAVLLR